MSTRFGHSFGDAVCGRTVLFHNEYGVPENAVCVSSRRVNPLTFCSAGLRSSAGSHLLLDISTHRTITPTVKHRNSPHGTTIMPNGISNDSQCHRRQRKRKRLPAQTQHCRRHISPFHQRRHPRIEKYRTAASYLPKADVNSQQRYNRRPAAMSICVAGSGSFARSSFISRLRFSRRYRILHNSDALPCLSGCAWAAMRRYGLTIETVSTGAYLRSSYRRTSQTRAGRRPIPPVTDTEYSRFVQEVH